MSTITLFTSALSAGTLFSIQVIRGGFSELRDEKKSPAFIGVPISSIVSDFRNILSMVISAPE